MNFEELYRILAPRLTNWLIATGSTYSQACDLTQTTFLKLWSMRDSLEKDDTKVSSLAFTIARNLRKNSTIQERRLWNLLKNRQFYNLKFKRQQPIGDYIVDFICKEAKIIIEVDGGQHNEPENIEYDKTRTEYLNNLGYKVVRFWNNEIYENIEFLVLRLKEDINPHQEHY